MQYYNSQAKRNGKSTPWNGWISLFLAFFFSSPSFPPSFSFIPCFLSFFLDFWALFLHVIYNLLLFSLPHSLPSQPLSWSLWQRLLWSDGWAAIAGMVLSDWAWLGTIQNWDKNRKEKGKRSGAGYLLKWSKIWGTQHNGQHTCCEWNWDACTTVFGVQAWWCAVGEAWGGLQGESSLSLTLPIPLPGLFLAFFLSFLYCVFFMKLSIDRVKIKNI